MTKYLTYLTNFFLFFPHFLQYISSHLRHIFDKSIYIKLLLKNNNLVSYSTRPGPKSVKNLVKNIFLNSTVMYTTLLSSVCAHPPINDHICIYMMAKGFKEMDDYNENIIGESLSLVSPLHVNSGFIIDMYVFLFFECHSSISGIYRFCMLNSDVMVTDDFLEFLIT